MSKVIEIKSLNKSFTQAGEKLHILKDIDLSVGEGEVISLVGESGSGKSTLLQVIGGLIGFDSGELLVCGQNLRKLSDNKKTRLRRNNIGFIYQQHHLLSDFSALENVELACKISGKSAKQSLLDAKVLLNKLGLGDRLNHRPAELSGGQQQRVAIARAFANNPKLVLADEPTGNLDQANSDIVSDLFVEISKEFGTNLVIATHNKEISRKTDRVYKISSGHFSVV